MKLTTLISFIVVLSLFVFLSPVSWPEELQPMSLSTAVATALEQNPTLNAMRNETRAAALEKRE